MSNILNKIHKIKLDGRNIKFYLKTGFDYIKTGDIIEVLSEFLNPNSSEIITAKCESCETYREVTFVTFNRCKKGFVCCAKCRIAKTSKNLKKMFNVTNVSQLPSAKKKRITTFRKKYGVENISQLKEVREKIEKSVLKKYGVKNISQSKIIKEQKIKSMLLHHGVEHSFQSEIIRNKAIITLQKNYNTNLTNASQIAEIMDKKIENRYKPKIYVFPSGKIVKYQGYENYALDFLLKIYSENDITIGNLAIEKLIGKIFYRNNNRYFPDIYIQKENLIIEVKSTYTINFNSEMVKLKEMAVIKKGHRYVNMVFTAKGVLI